MKPEQNILTNYILDLSNQDKLVQYQLKLLIDQINPEITPKQVGNIQLMYTTLLKNSLISPDFWKEVVSHKFSKPVKEFNPTWRFKPLPSPFAAE